MGMESGDSKLESKVHMLGIWRHGMGHLPKCSGCEGCEPTVQIPSLSRFSLPALCSHVEQALPFSRLSSLPFTSTLWPLLSLATK